MKPRLLIDSEALEFLRRLKRRDREFLPRRFEEIRDAPGQFSDYRHRDETGRDLDGHIAERFAIEFWDDFADRHVKILAVTWAEEMK